MKRNLNKRLGDLKGLLVIGLLLISQHLSGQSMEVTGADLPPYTPENLISDVFLGAGVQVLDIQYSGNPAAVGYFDKAEQNIGIDRGLLLTTGIANKAAQTGADGAQDNNDLNQEFRTETDLALIAKGAPIRNVAQYLITFIPTADTLRFNFVFASEEYPEFVCSEFNDVFGFFISGPGYSGPYENGAENIALIPGTSLPVAINNVNGGASGVWGSAANCEAPLGSLNYAHLFNPNENTALQPVYDGFTNVFSAEAVVQPCEVYTMKLAIADVSDEGYDSGVFLEAKSFSTDHLIIKSETESPDGTLVEGCSSGRIKFELSSPRADDFTINYHLFGTATNGHDYTQLPGVLIIPAGETKGLVEVEPLSDGIIESAEVLYIDVQSDECSRDTIAMYIKDNELIPPMLLDTTVCEGSFLTLDGTTGNAVFDAPQFDNNAPVPIAPTLTPVYSEIEVTGVRPELLGPDIIESVCIEIDHNRPEDLDIYLLAPNGSFVLLSSDNGASSNGYPGTCFTTGNGAQIDGYSGDLSQIFEPEGHWSDLWNQSDSVNGIWRLLIIDDQFGANGVLRNWNITFKPHYAIDFNWTPPTNLSCLDCPVTTAYIGDAQDYILTLTDIYGCEVADTAEIEVFPTINAPVPSCSNTSWNSVSIEWPLDTLVDYYEVSVNGGPFQSPNNGPNSELISNLMPNTEVIFEIRAVGICSSPSTIFSCASLDCMPPDIEISELTDVSCYGLGNGSVRLKAEGIGTYFNYELDGMSSQDGFFQGLSPGTYLANVTDSLSCVSSILVEITEPKEFETNGNVLDVNCFDERTGSLSFEVSGGTYPYAYNWSNGSTDSLITGLAANTYFLSISDANDCKHIVSANISQPLPLKNELETEQVTCFGDKDGRITASTSGGNAPYRYDWGNGTPISTQNTISDLSGGLYFVTIYDANNCEFMDSVSVVEHPMLELNLDPQDPTCNGYNDGSIISTVSGGTNSYSFDWSNGWTTEHLDSISGGQYVLMLSDSDHCITSDTVLLVEPEEIIYQAAIEATKCANTPDGFAELTILGGNGNYQITWDNGINGFQNDSLTAGLNEATIVDALGCAKEVEIMVPSPEPISYELTKEDLSCFDSNDGWVEVQSSGGTGIHSYLWNNENGTHRLDSLPVGNYTVMISDENDCRADGNIELFQPLEIQAEANLNHITCFGYRDGSIQLLSSGGSGNHAYQWFSSSNSFSDEANIDFLTSDIYKVEIRDDNNCLKTFEFEIIAPDPLLAIVDAYPVTCKGRKDGRIVIQPDGGTAPYLTKLDGFEFDLNELKGLDAGNYAIDLIDANNCLYQLDEIIVEEGSEIVIRIGEDEVIKYGDTVFFEPKIDTRNPIEKAKWSAYDLDIIDCLDCVNTFALPIGQTTFTLEVEDIYGCKAEDRINVYVKSDRNVQVPTGFTPNRDGTNDKLLVHGANGTRVNLFQVYDRWGELLFEMTDFEVNQPELGWDGSFRGQKMNSGVYIWYLEVEYEDGGKDNLNGSTTLIR